MGFEPVTSAILVDTRTHRYIAEVIGSNPVEALIFFRLLPSNCFNWKFYCDDHSSLSSTSAVQNMNFKYISHHFIAQEDMNSTTGIAEVTGSNPVEALIFFRFLPSNCLNWKIYCDDHSSLSSTTAVQNMNVIYFTQV